jgi:hypothetical protein
MKLKKERKNENEKTEAEKGETTTELVKTKEKDKKENMDKLHCRTWRAATTKKPKGCRHPFSNWLPSKSRITLDRGISSRRQT